LGSGNAHDEGRMAGSVQAHLAGISDRAALSRHGPERARGFALQPSRWLSAI
jgi:hypothetical protein